MLELQHQNSRLTTLAYCSQNAFYRQYNNFTIDSKTVNKIRPNPILGGGGGGGEEATQFCPSMPILEKSKLEIGKMSKYFKKK